MRKILFIALSALMLGIAANAKEITIYGDIYSRTTSKSVPGVFVEIMSPDSVVLAKDTAQRISYVFKAHTLYEDTTGHYEIKVEKLPQNYIMRLSKPGYDTKYVDFSLKGLGSREIKKHIPNIYINPEREALTLDEITVAATKIKFYNKGDTIVYNADAFNLPEGSMLDALIAQMPGVELKEGGQIYVNGRKVESLLLNGKDFFKGDNQIMLDNIGVYAVNNIQVYEKAGELNELLGTKMKDDMEYVMDVKLKKEYNVGTIFNAEAGYGLQHRYTGRLFGMRYTDNSRLSAYGNFNNTNDLDRPSDGSGWSMGQSSAGRPVINNGGIDYMVENPQHTWELSGNLDVKHLKLTYGSDVISYNYLPQSATYNYQYSSSVNKNLSISTDHTWKLKKEMWNLKVNPKFSYNDIKAESNSISGLFNEEVQAANKEVLENLFTGNYSGLRKALINRNRVESKSNQHGINASIWAENAYKIKGSPDGFTFWFESNYKSSTPESETRQAIDFGEKPANSTLQLRKSTDHPQYQYMVRGSARYFLNFPAGSFSLGGYYQYDRQRKDIKLMMMEARSVDAEADFAPDQQLLPDPANSYNSNLYESSVFLMPRLNLDFGGNWGKFNIYAEAKGVYDRRHLFYTRGLIDVKPLKSEFYLNRGTMQLQYNTKNNKLRMWAVYDISTRLADLVDMIDLFDDTDPLNIQLGNPDLKNAINHNIYGNFNLQMPGNAYIYGYIDHEWSRNYQTRGYSFNSTTGVRMDKTYNVNGNRATSMRLSYNRDLWLKGLSGGIGVSGNLIKYADMIGEDAAPQLQFVNNNSITADLNLRYSLNDMLRVGYNFSVSKNHSEYDRTGTTTDYTTLINNFDLFVKLPWNFSFNSDLRIMTRRGYVDDALNKTYLVWNPTLKYKLNSNWEFMAKGYDVTDGTYATTINVTAQSRTQTTRLTMPRYVLFTVKYTLDNKPKNK